MAVISKLDLENAKLDADDLVAFVSDAAGVVTPRTGGTYPNARQLVADFQELIDEQTIEEETATAQAVIATTKAGEAATSAAAAATSAVQFNLIKALIKTQIARLTGQNGGYSTFSPVGTAVGGYYEANAYTAVDTDGDTSAENNFARYELFNAPYNTGQVFTVFYKATNNNVPVLTNISMRFTDGAAVTKATNQNANMDGRYHATTFTLTGDGATLFLPYTTIDEVNVSFWCAVIPGAIDPSLLDMILQAYNNGLKGSDLQSLLGSTLLRDPVNSGVASTTTLTPDTRGGTAVFKTIRVVEPGAVQANVRIQFNETVDTGDVVTVFYNLKVNSGSTPTWALRSSGNTVVNSEGSRSLTNDSLWHFATFTATGLAAFLPLTTASATDYEVSAFGIKGDITRNAPLLAYLLNAVSPEPRAVGDLTSMLLPSTIFLPDDNWGDVDFRVESLLPIRRTGLTYDLTIASKVGSFSYSRIGSQQVIFPSKRFGSNAVFHICDQNNLDGPLVRAATLVRGANTSRTGRRNCLNLGDSNTLNGTPLLAILMARAAGFTSASIGSYQNTVTDPLTSLPFLAEGRGGWKACGYTNIDTSKTPLNPANAAQYRIDAAAGTGTYAGNNPWVKEAVGAESGSNLASIRNGWYFSPAQYAINAAINPADIDIINIGLGTNDMNLATINTVAEYADAMTIIVNQILSDWPGKRINIWLSPFARNIEGNAKHANRWYSFVSKLLELFSGREAESIYVVPTWLFADPLGYSMTLGSADVNGVKTGPWVDPIHPALYSSSNMTIGTREQQAAALFWAMCY